MRPLGFKDRKRGCNSDLRGHAQPFDLQSEMSNTVIT